LIIRVSLWSAKRRLAMASTTCDRMKDRKVYLVFLRSKATHAMARMTTAGQGFHKDSMVRMTDAINNTQGKISSIKSLEGAINSPKYPKSGLNIIDLNANTAPAKVVPRRI